MQVVYPDMPWMKDLLQVADYAGDSLRNIGYEILKALARVIDTCSNAVNGVLSIDITKIGPIQHLVGKVSPIGWSVLAIALICAGIYIVVHGGKNKALFQNLLLSVVLIVAIPFMFSQINAFKNAGVSDMSAQLTGGTSIGQQLLRSAVTDVQNSQSGKKQIDASVNPYYLNINARLPKGEPFSYKIESVSGSDKTGYKLYGEPLGNGFFGMGEERLYAYTYDFGYPFIMMVITIVAMVFAGLKVARTVFDLTVHQIIAPVVFASDVNNGARTKKFLQSLFGSVIMMVLVLLILKIYIDLSSWVNQNISDFFVRILMIGGAAWGVIDGPDIVVKLLGVDAGVRSATSVLVGAAAAGSVAKGAAHTVGALTHGAVNGARAAAGGGASLRDFNNKVKRGANAFKEDAAAVADGKLPENDSLTDYANNLHRQSDGTKGFAGGYNRFSNLASMTGYAMGKAKSAVTGGIPNAAKAPSILGAINGATKGTPLESAASASAIAVPNDNPMPNLSGGAAVLPKDTGTYSAVTPKASNANSVASQIHTAGKMADILSQAAVPTTTAAAVIAADEETENSREDEMQSSDYNSYSAPPVEHSIYTAPYTAPQREAAATAAHTVTIPQENTTHTVGGIWPTKRNERK